MAVFIEARTEPFAARREEIANGIRDHGRSHQSVRRPTRGYQLKEDVFAVIRVMGPDGQFMPVIDAAGEEYSVETNSGMTTSYSNFFIQSVSEQRQEKQQIVETFGDSWIFFFGEAPRLLQVGGYLLNTADFNWRAEFWENYDRYFRGTRLVELGARLYLMYDDIIVEGYLISAAAQESTAPAPAVLQFNFQMFVTGYTNISKIGDPNFPTPTNVDYAQLSSYDQAIQDWQRNRNLQRNIAGETINAANRRAYQLGVGALLADSIRANMVNAGDPSISAFVARAYMATRAVATLAQLASSPDSATNASVNPYEGVSMQGPMRQQFTHNIDEYVSSGEESRYANRHFAHELSMAERWQEMDSQMDAGLDGMTSGGSDAGGSEFWDVMGRAGRTQQQIIENGGDRLVSQNINRGMLIGAASRSGNQAALARSVPFGMMVMPGEML